MPWSNIPLAACADTFWVLSFEIFSKAVSAIGRLLEVVQQISDRADEGFCLATIRESGLAASAVLLS
jgi:hypothetical protein